ncbi:Hypothetical protein A7982_12600 [Minicystis rosea]|nr:Hypothetical protein A7982_12600 [Minicystis rosea]
MTLSAPTDRRDRLLVELLAADPDLSLLRWDSEVALLFSAGASGRIFIMTVPEDLPGDRLRELFSAHMGTLTQDGPPTQVVVVGGGPEAQAALSATIPYFAPAQVGFDHLADDGTLTHIKSRHLPLLESAAARIDMDAPIDPQPLADALARGQKLIEQDRAVVSKLSGRSTVTGAITAICVVLTGLGYLWGGTGGYNEALWRMGANELNAVKGGEPWRLLASAFLHGDVIHLVVNMIALWSFGPMLEAIFGARRYLLLYGASALGGSLASAFLHPGDPRVSVGASGAIWGLMTAFLALALRPKGVLPPMMAASLRRQVWVPIVINLLYSLQAGIDMLAHIGGGVIGFALTATVLTSGVVPVEQRRSVTDVERKRSPLVTGATSIIVAAMAFSVAAALVTGRPWQIGAAPVLQRTTIGDTGISLEVPTVAEKKPRPSDGGTTITSFGTLRTLPVAFLVTVSGIVDAPEEELLAEAQKASEDDASSAGNTRRQTMIGGRRALVEVHAKEKLVEGVTYTMVAGGRLVRVFAFARVDRSDAWKGIEEKVAATVRGP